VRGATVDSSSVPTRRRDGDDAEVDAARDAGDTLGGSSRCGQRDAAGGGGYDVAERRLDGRLAAALMRIQAMKAVEVGLGFESARRRGSRVHDEIVPARPAAPQPQQRGRRRGRHDERRGRGRPRGDEAAVDAAARDAQRRHGDRRGVEATVERSDVCAAPAASVVAEAVVRCTLADALLEKTGGDSCPRCGATSTHTGPARGAIPERARQGRAQSAPTPDESGPA
jgi:chorismate synthase